MSVYLNMDGDISTKDCPQSILTTWGLPRQQCSDSATRTVHNLTTSTAITSEQPLRFIYQRVAHWYWLPWPH